MVVEGVAYMKVVIRVPGVQVDYVLVMVVDHVAIRKGVRNQHVPLVDTARL